MNQNTSTGCHGILEGVVQPSGSCLNALEPITILLVDDDDQLRALCRSFLTVQGFQVLEADNGMDALLIAAECGRTIDVLITDLAMPGISGLDLGQAFEQIWPGVSVLYISGSGRETVGALLSQDCAFLPKPFDAEGLVRAVAACMHARV